MCESGYSLGVPPPYSIAGSNLLHPNQALRLRRLTSFDPGSQAAGPSEIMGTSQ